MTIQIEQLDARFKCFPFWSHRAEFPVYGPRGFASRLEVMKSFVETREELWNTFGPGCDREELHRLCQIRPGPDWGWWRDPKGGAPYIYFKRGPLLTWFLMRT